MINLELILDMVLTNQSCKNLQDYIHLYWNSVIQSETDAFFDIDFLMHAMSSFDVVYPSTLASVSVEREDAQSVLVTLLNLANVSFEKLNEPI
jgi:hypothetical protein